MRIVRLPVFSQEQAERVRALDSLASDWRKCTRCPLGVTATTHVLWEIPVGFFEHGMDILFIGEGPGETEDKEGMPFVGKAGTFLRETIEEQNPEGLKLGFANLVACRPTPRKGKNRPPEYLEVRTCSPRLRDFVRIVQPLMVVGLGRVPETYLPRILKEAEYTGRRLVFRHPSFFLHNGGQNSPAYPDWAEAFRILFTVVRGMKEKGMK